MTITKEGAVRDLEAFEAQIKKTLIVIIALSSRQENQEEGSYTRHTERKWQG